MPCPFYDKVKGCSLKEKRKAISFGGFGGCITPNYPKCDAYKKFYVPVWSVS